MKAKKPTSIPGEGGKLRLGIRGLDDLIKGGLSRGITLCLFGPSASGKTLFGMHFLIGALEEVERAIYLRLGPRGEGLLESLPFQERLARLSAQKRFQAQRLPLEASQFSKTLESLKDQGGLSRARVLIELAPTPGSLTAAQLALVNRIQDFFQSEGATCIFTARFLPQTSKDFKAVDGLAPDAAGIFLLTYKSIRDLKRQLTVLKCDSLPGRKVSCDLEFNDGILEAAGAARAGRRRGGQAAAMQVSAPYFQSPQERKRYGEQLSRLMNARHPESPFYALKSELSLSDSLTSLYAPTTDFGPMLLYNPIVPFLARQKLLSPLEDLFPDYPDRFQSLGVRRGFVDNHLYAVPKHLSMRLLFFRKDLLGKHGFKPPRTWNELEEQSKTIVKAERDPRLEGFLFEARPFLNMTLLLEHVWSEDQDLYENPGNWLLNKPAVGAALRRMSRYLHEAKITPRHALSIGHWDAIDEFLEGRAVFLHHSSDAIRLIHKKGSEAREAFDWCFLPSSDPFTFGRYRVSGPCWVIPRNSRFPEAAGKFLKAMMAPAFQSDLEPAFGWPFPSLTALYKDPKVLKSHPFYSQAQHLLGRGKLIEELSYFQGNFLNWQGAANEVLNPFFARPASQGDIEAVVGALEKALQAFLPKALLSPLVGQAVSCIRENLDRPLQVRELAAKLRVSSPYLIQVFKKETGATPLHFMNQARLDKAKELLEQTSYNVSEVAAKVGFRDIFHFSKAFKKYMKRNPSDFKRHGLRAHRTFE